MKTQKRRLMWHGMLLFLLGLITGLLERRFTNVRMGLQPVHWYQGRALAVDQRGARLQELIDGTFA